MLKLAHAVYDENGKSANGMKGDQTGREVLIVDWYVSGKGWTHVIRAKDSGTATVIAESAAEIAANDNIGYNQNNRLSLYNEAVKKDFAFNLIKTKVETDCSAMVAVCVIAAGVLINHRMYTGNQLAVLKATGKFKILTGDKYLTSIKHLKNGDILFRPGHTAIVVDRKMKLVRPVYMKGNDVMELQKLIGFTGNDLDGIYGPATDKRIQEIIKYLK